MTARRHLRESVDAFERIQRAFASNSGQEDPNWRRKIIDLRRELQDSLVRVRTALEAAEQAEGRTPTFQALASALSTLRSAIALHQAEWPAVAIDTGDPSYRQAVKQLRHVTDAFRTAARAAIAQGTD